MYMRQLLFYLILIYGSNNYLRKTVAINPVQAIGFNEALDIIKITKDLIIWLGKTWNIIDGQIEFSEIPLPLLERTEEKLFGKINIINQKLSKLTDQLESIGTNTISTILSNLPERLRFEIRLQNLLDCFTTINVSYKKMEKYIDARSEIEKTTLQDFANSVVSHDAESVQNILEKMYSFIVSDAQGITDTGILKLLIKALEVMPYDITHGLQSIENVWSYANTYSELRSIHALYETFRRFQMQQTKPGRTPSPKQAWNDLVFVILQDPRNNVLESIERIHEFIEKKNLFIDCLKEVEGDMLCNSHQSPQQVIYNLYNSIALTELKGYTMIQFSYMLKKLYDEGNFTKEAQLARERYQERTNNIIKVVQSTMQKAPRDLWKCDPKKHVKGQTYEEFTQLLQGYIQNEVDLNPEGTCRENCGEYVYTKSHGCYQNLYCRQQRRCNGKIIKCRYIDSDMWICPSDPSTNRRYEYVEYENGRVLGRKQGCRKGTTKVDSWWRWLFWHCSYCLCLCDEQGIYSDRYINLRPSIADIANNKVVTGLRFVKHNRIIHLQIQEGKLLPRGTIDITTLHWVPVEDYKITDSNIYNGQDYHTLSWEKRAIDLDDLTAGDDYLVTGVRFKLIGSHINFEIYVTPFDFETGQLIEPLNKSVFKDNPNTDSALKNPRKRVQLINPDIPTRSPTASIPDSKPDQYIEFENTDLDRDAGQTTVPFFDAQPIESLFPVPLNGAGIFHKGRKNFGGFITPKIITYDYSKHLQIAFPEQDNSEPMVN